MTVTPGQVYNLHVGTGSSSAAAGEDSFFNNTTTVLAKGGNSAPNNTQTGATGGSAAASVGDIKYDGGDGSDAGFEWLVFSTVYYGGGGGSSAGTGNPGVDATTNMGAVAPTGGGNGGNGKYGGNGAGTDGAFPGGGGGGARRTSGTQQGGNGGNGQVIITWSTSSPEINIQGNTVTITDGDTAPSTVDGTDFGSVNVATGSVAQTFTIQNTGTSALTIGGVTIGGANPTNFTISTLPALSVPAGGSTTFTIVFDPNAAGLLTATISIVNNDGNENPYDFTIQGTGTGNAEINITGNATNIADGDTTPVAGDWTDFGNADVSTGSIVRVFTVQNLGTGVLTIGSISIAGTNAADFSVTALPNATVAVGGSTTFSVTFNPSFIGLHTATVSVINSDSNENPYDFAIQGNGTGLPEINVLGNSTTIADGDTTPALADWTDFGNADVATGLISQTFTIQNTGNTTLTIGAFTIGGANASNFTVTSAPAATVAPGASTTFTVTFNPDAAGIRVATISFVNNDSDENPYNFTVQGTGTGNAEMNVTGNATNIADGDTTPIAADWTDFGNADVSTGTIVRVFTIQNTGAGVLTVGSISIAGANAADFTVTALPTATVAAGGNTTFSVTFNPSFIGLHTATVSVVNNDSDENPYNFAIQGMGTGVPEINVVGNSTTIADGDTTPALADWTDFGPADVATGSVSQTFTIQNTGTVALTIGAFTIGGTNPTNFTITSAPAATVAPGSSTTFTVTFNPDAAGIRGAVISFLNNDSNENPYNFNVQGTGTGNAEINITGNLVTIADGDTTPIVADWTDFGNADITTGSITRTFTIQNTSSGVLSIGAITISGTNAANFTVTALPAATVTGVGNTTFSVTFDPSFVGLHTATISIVNNDSNENPYNFAIQGNGTGFVEINVQGNATTITDGDAGPTVTDWTDVGTTDILTGTITRVFTIFNTGNIDLTIGAITIGGANANNFAVTSLPAATVPGGGTTTFAITFDPDAVGVRNATLSFVNNDSNENPYDFAIRGTGSATQEINVQGNNINIVDGDTTPDLTDWTDFGPADVATGTLSRTFMIHNTGSATLGLSAPTITGANAANFTITTFPAGSVAPGGSTALIVAFNPDVAGLRTATISFANTDSDENPYNFNIQGTGTTGNPEINVQGGSVNIVSGDITPSTTDLTDFGSVAVAAGTLTSTFAIQNVNTAVTALSVGTITITGANSGDFTVTTAPAATVNIGQSTTFVVTFNPSAPGIRVATISITNNDTNENPYTFNIRGNGLEPEINVTGNSLTIPDGDTTPILADNTNFGSANITAATIVKTFVIENTSSATMPLTVGAITITGANAADFTITANPATSVAVGSSTSFSVTFNPTTNGTKNATINIANDDANENPYNFSIIAVGTSPEIDVQGNFISIADGDTTPFLSDQTDFGSVSIDGGSTLVTYTIINTGVGQINVATPTLTGAGAASFSIVVAPASTIAASASTTFQVKFQPTTAGIKDAVLSFVNDDTDENPYNFSITGLGVRTYADTDGDGISDNNDIDDDNDGIVDIVEQQNCGNSPFATSVEYTFLNETFGAGTTKGLININIPGATCTYCYEDGVVGPNVGSCDMQNDWSLNDGEYTVTHMISGPAGHPGNLATWSNTNWTAQEDHTVGDTNGRMAVFNASENPQTFYETTISGVIPNVPITYTFWAMNIMSLAAYPNTNLPNITVEFRDLSNNLLSTFNTGNLGRCNGATSNNTCVLSDWKQYTTSVNLGDVSAFIISFRNNAPGGNGNDLAIDDISIKQQYCDSDGDNIANIFDLDVDNDGIPDIEEVGQKVLSNGRGIMDLSSVVWLDANANGLHDTIDAMIASHTYVVPNSDGDTTLNFMDLDSDNDSIFDVDEAGLINGDGDITGDGVGDGADTDLDGILNLYDAYTGYGTLIRPFAQDTDNNLTPDYIQGDSNNDTVTDISSTLYSSLDANNDGIIDGTTDVDHDGIVDVFDTNILKTGSPRDLNRKLYLELDGRNDYGEGTQLLGGLPAATIMGWIKIPADFSTSAVIFGQDNFSIQITAGKQLKAYFNSLNITITTPIETDRWYHIAAVFNGADPTKKVIMYLNGVEESTTGSGASTLSASSANFTMGKNSAANLHYFKGALDEVRAFNVALTPDQLRKMIYQEIRQNGTAVRGEVIPKDIESTLWANLLACYRFDAYKDDIVDNFTTSTIDVASDPSSAKIYNVKNIKYQLAPMPFVTTQTGPLDLAVSQNNFVHGADLITYDWSILQLKHNMSIGYNLTNLGLVVDPGVRLDLINDNQLRNTWYFRLDGVLDLKAKSQLVQTLSSDFEAASIGHIEKDQQGTTNKFNYNYWSSPVGTINGTTNNNTYTVAGVMRDGTNPDSIQPISWTSGYNSLPTTPITLSSTWIYKFQNVSSAYANWSVVGQNGTLLPGQGFTLKGSSALSESQNYTFVGKPFNGIITTPIAASNMNLSGNPYASALDSQKFLLDNLGALTGAIYLWEHFSTNTSHVTQNYQGGYATLNLVGGTPPVSPVEITGQGSSTRIPGRYIPVGQGFFVAANSSGGTITFDNSQRAFVKEDNSQSNILFRGSAAQTPPVPDDQDDDEPDGFAKIRLGFNFSNFHRQVLLGFMNELATSGIDPGYDAIHVDSQPSDMCFITSNVLLNIQGDGYFNINNIYPLQVKTATAGTVQFTLDATENFEETQSIFIYDNVTGIYHDIRAEIANVQLPAGTVSDRFSLRFNDNSLGTDELTSADKIGVAFTQNDEALNIKNPLTDVTVTKAVLYNMLGQSLAEYEVVDQDQRSITIPVSNFAAGTYIVKIITSGGDLSRKIIIE
jgi:hypothetical protein